MKLMKKTVSLFLALTLCLGLSATVFAVDIPGPQLPPGNWGDGPSLTLKGVVNQRETQLELPMCYDVAVGGSMVLKLDFPAGHNRIYGFRMTGVYISPDCTDALQSNEYFGLEGWDIPAEKMGDFYTEESGKTEYVYEFTDYEVGEYKGYDKVIYMDVFWMDDLVGNGEYESYGSAYFYIHVVPAASAASESAMPTNDQLTVNGVLQSPTVYKINGSNFFKIRDLAAMLSGTEKQFDVGYDNALKSVTVTTGKGYEKLDTDLAGAATGGNQTADPSNDTIYIDGQKIDVTVYKIGGSNYFKLRDLGKALNFYVGWTAEDGVFIDTGKPYSE